MEQKELFELMTRFEQSSLTKLEIKENAFSLKVEKENSCKAVEPNRVEEKSMIERPKNASLIQVKAPIVGVFYKAPSPDAPPYVDAEQKVSKGQILCLVEAMKMMNELKSPVDGIVKSIKGINGELVEFDQVLFEVEPC